MQYSVLIKVHTIAQTFFTFKKTSGRKLIFPYFTSKEIKSLKKFIHLELKSELNFYFLLKKILFIKKSCLNLYKESQNNGEQKFKREIKGFSLIPCHSFISVSHFIRIKFIFSNRLYE